MAAPEFTLFVKPYLEGWLNGEEGNTPITAEILNNSYDAFLLALNDWATAMGLLVEGIPTKTSDLTNDSNFVSDLAYIHTDNNYTTTEKNKLSGVEDNANNYSLPTASASTLGGVKVDGITITIANGVISAVGGGGTDVEGNPSGTPTAVLSSIRIGNDIFSIPGGGGGGSSVSFTQILATGTKIGTITIDGVPTDIYAPAPPTKTSDLTNDSNFVSDASYVHTDNNYTTTEKNKLADLNQVEANPSSGTSAGDLTSIEIDGTKYNIPSGGGGTTVVANPSGTATDELNKLQVGNTIYSIPEGGGGSSSGLYAVEEVLFDTETSLEETSYQLNSSIDNYDFIRICLGINTENANWIFSVDQLHDTLNECIFYVGAGYTTAIANSNGDELIFTGFSSFGSNRTLRGVYGLKLTEPASGSGHVILNDAGTSLAQEDDLQFKGVYSHDDSTNGKTVVEVTRTMTSAEYALLSDEEKKGVILVTDAPDPSASGFTDYEGTLTAGQTSLTITGLEIDNTKLFDYYTDILGVNPTNIVVTNGQVTLTFPAQQTDMSVIVSVRAKTHIDKPFDIDLSDFVTDKIWKYYDSANWSDATSDGSKITIAGGEDRSDWTTATWVCIDLTQYPVPNNLSKLKIHLPSIETLGYSGVCVVTDNDKFGPGSNGGSDTMIRKTRMEISSGIYVLGDPSLGINETDYTLEIPCTKSDLSRYLYIGAADGVNPSDSNTYSNSLNGSFDVEIDGIWYE